MWFSEECLQSCSKYLLRVKMNFLGRREMKEVVEWTKWKQEQLSQLSPSKQMWAWRKSNHQAESWCFAFPLAWCKNWEMGPGLFTFIHSQRLVWDYLPPRYLFLTISSFCLWDQLLPGSKERSCGEILSPAW